MKKNIKLVIAYDGTNYHGWQVQKDKRTIQGTIEEQLRRITGENIRIIGSGRTDAGVHALNQVANFKTNSDLTPLQIKRALNSLLPEDIYVKSAECVPLKFHARYMAKSKTYEYRILNREEPDIFQRKYHWHVIPKLDIEVMKTALSLLKGTHDFSSFVSAGGATKNHVRTIYKIELYKEDDLIRIVIEANGFLRHMVRNIVGTVVQLGYGKISLDQFKDIFAACDRQAAGKKAPAKGLFLVKVTY
ncbi:MAG: tRNA pseudouridine(38-40) synthase TruA [Deltaproteobacteria bacterium]|nr:MAG: tRNA pseudouridine(38-40) synthase TruA [Deltaproteobacteria bacterium]